jgi:hypothetical protein
LLGSGLHDFKGETLAVIDSQIQISFSLMSMNLDILHHHFLLCTLVLVMFSLEEVGRSDVGACVGVWASFLS